MLLTLVSINTLVNITADLMRIFMMLIIFISLRRLAYTGAFLLD